MSERQGIPVGLAEIPPGPELSAVLDMLDPGRLSAADCVAVLKARARQVAHEQARFLAVMVQVGLCDPDGDGEGVARLDEPLEWAADEVRAALVWTRRAAESRFWSAHDLVTRLPRVHHAMDRGRIDQPRARVFAEWTEQLTIEQARRICDLLLPIAAELTTGQLIARIRQMAIAIDPQWAERKYTEALKTRRVVGSRNPDGTANVSGLDLPVDQAAAACARIDALARRVKQSGDRRPIDMIRADLYLGMLDGTYQGCDDQEIIEHLLAEAGIRDGGDTQDEDASGHPAAGRLTDEHRPTGQRGDGEPRCESQQQGGGERHGNGERFDDGQPPGDGPVRAGRAPAYGPAPGHGRSAAPRPVGHGSDSPDGETSTGDGHGRDVQRGGVGRGAGPRGGGRRGADMTGAQAPGEDAQGEDPPSEARHAMDGQCGDALVGGRDPACSGGGGAGRSHSGGRRTRGGAAAGVDLQVKLSTLLGLDEHPGEIAGWGFTHANDARAIAARQTGARWRYVICDDHGALLAEGLVGRRPLSFPPRTPIRGGSVELQIPLTLLLHLTATGRDAQPAWAAIIDQIRADLAAITDLTSDRGDMTIAGPDTSDSDTSDSGAADGGEDTDGGEDADRREQVRDRRFPDTGLRRKVRARDRTCTFPGCRMPAGSTDTDHTRQWQDHGRTQEHNLASLCRHDHRLKDEGGWLLTRTRSGLLQWTSPLGRTYETRPPPIIIPLPGPQPRPQHPPSAWSLATADGAETDTPIWYEPRVKPSGQGEPPPARPRPDPADEPPPF